MIYPKPHSIYLRGAINPKPFIDSYFGGWASQTGSRIMTYGL